MISRINLILKIKNLTASQFADEIGVQRSSMSHILSGRNNPSLDFISKILIRFPDIKADWLLFGKGEMYDSEKQNSNKKQEVNNVRSNELNLFSNEYDEEAHLDVKDNEIKQEEISQRLPLNEQPKQNNQAFVDEKRENRDDVKDTEKYEFLKKDKKIKKLLILYTDNTFEEFMPNIN